MNRQGTLVWRALFAAMLVMMGMSTARGDTVSFGPDFEGTFTGFSSGSFTLPQFDTLGGTRTLTGVNVEVMVESFGGKREFDNQSPTGGLVTIAIGATVRVKGPVPGIGSQIVVIPDAVTTASTTITGTTGDLPADFAGTDYAFVNGAPVKSDTKSASRTGAGDMAPYIGTGDVSFAWDLAGTSTTGEDVSVTSGGAFLTTPPSYHFYTSVTYTFVPEPGVCALVAAASVIVFRRPRRTGSLSPGRIVGAAGTLPSVEEQMP